MSELPPSGDRPIEPPAEAPREHRAAVADEGPQMPAWVPIVIGLILVTIAGLAVYTGLRFRNNTIVDRIVHPRRTTARGGQRSGAPGEPGPGASLVFPGEGADNTPTANEPVAGRSRVEISGGGPNGVVGTIRLTARRGMVTKIVPDDAMIYVNEVAIGEAKQFNAQDEVYDFPAAGSYTIRVTAPGYEDRQFVVTASDSAKPEIAVIDAKLTPVIR